jgi:hypothetical protein
LGIPATFLEYFVTFKKALLTFKHQLVFDPFSKKQVRLNKVDASVLDLSFAGNIFDNAIEHAQGKISCRYDEYKVTNSLHLDEHFILAMPKNEDEKNLEHKHLDIWKSKFKMTDTRLIFVKETKEETSHDQASDQLFTCTIDNEVFQLKLYKDHTEPERKTSDKWPTFQNQEPEFYEPFTMGQISNSNYILPDLQVCNDDLKCVCGNFAEARQVKHDYET